jgi:hypothetical protein
LGAEPNRSAANVCLLPRRDFLTAGAAWAAALIGSRCRRASANSELAATTVGALVSESNRRVAALGRRFHAEDPELARRLAREVEAGVALWCVGASCERRARIARARFLTRRRIGAEFARGDALLISGWILARSEGAVAAYISSLEPLPPGET